jgi:hypothetical protein
MLTVLDLFSGIDRRFMAGAMTQAEYDAEMRELARWAEAQYSRR